MILHEKKILVESLRFEWELDSSSGYPLLYSTVQNNVHFAMISNKKEIWYVYIKSMIEKEAIVLSVKFQLRIK